MIEKPVKDIDDLADEELVGIAVMIFFIVAYCVMTVCSLIRCTWWVTDSVGNFVAQAAVGVGALAGLLTIYGGIYMLVTLANADVVDGQIVVLYFVFILIIVIDVCAAVTLIQLSGTTSQSTTDFDEICCCFASSPPAPIQIPPPQIQIQSNNNIKNNTNNNNNNNNNNDNHDLNAIEMGEIDSQLKIDIDNVFLWFGGKYSKEECHACLLECNKDIQQAIEMLSEEDKKNVKPTNVNNNDNEHDDNDNQQNIRDSTKSPKRMYDATAMTDTVQFVQEQVDCSEKQAVDALEHCNYYIDGAIRYLKLELLVQMSGVARHTARMALAANDDNVDRAFLSLDVGTTQ